MATRIRGFTLIELMVAVAVLAILMTIAAPSLSSFFDRGRLRGAADDVVSLVSTARGEAVKTGRDARISVGGTTAAWCVGANQLAAPAAGSPIIAITAGTDTCVCGTPSTCRVDGNVRVVNSANYPGVSVSAVGGSVTVDGKLGSIVGFGTTSFRLISPTTRYEVLLTVSPLGQSRLCVPTGKPAIAGYPSC